jgi:hypothetical protein
MLSDVEIEQLTDWADDLIPAEGPWPSPRDAGITTFFRRIFDDQGDVARVRRALAALRDNLDDGDGEGARVMALQSLEDTQPLVFRVLLEFVYFGYYSRPLVVTALNQTLECDYVSPPQPRGYEMDRLGDPVPSGRGSYTATDDVRRVQLPEIDESDILSEVRVGSNPRFGNSATTFT